MKIKKKKNSDGFEMLKRLMTESELCSAAIFESWHAVETNSNTVNNRLIWYLLQMLKLLYTLVGVDQSYDDDCIFIVG